MSSVTAQLFSGTYRAEPLASSFGFAVRHSGVFWYRGSLSDVTGTLHADGDVAALEGSARAESISIVEPAALRQHLLAPDFFDVEHHPEITFRSVVIDFPDGGRLAVDGELTIRGVTRPVSARGHYAEPRQSSFGEIAGIQLRTAFDRRDFGFEWQMTLPGGGNVLGWEVQVDIDLLLIREDPAASR